MTAPTHDGALIVRSREPFNAETPLELLARSELTPTKHFFVRSHGAIPHVDAGAHRVDVGGMVERPLALSLSDLRDRKSETVTATLACAGNRRAELAAVKPIPDELLWGAGAVGNAAWTGVPLRDVLLAARLLPGAGHVAFAGLDDADVGGQRVAFGASIPIEKALSPDVLLAHAMNGEPLEPSHGFPVRLVVPGYIGARSVKWLTSITVQDHPSSNYFQARGYRLVPGVDADSNGPSVELGEFSLVSAVCRVHEDGALGTTVAEGYAVAGGTRTVERVDVSLDGGKSWQPATFSRPAEPGIWRLWHAELEVGSGEREVVVRAWDSAANTQPEVAAAVWNSKGYMNSSWHRRRFTPTRP